MPATNPATPAKVFSAAVLPTGERDFQVGWSLGADVRRDEAPLASDVDGDGVAERVQLSSGGLCVLSADGAARWCAPPQWQPWEAALDDVDDDGLAELVVLAQQNEEWGPAWGTFVQVWEWRDGRFSLLWRSPADDYRRVWLADADGDGTRDIGVDEGG